MPTLIFLLLLIDSLAQAFTRVTSITVAPGTRSQDMPNIRQGQLLTPDTKAKGLTGKVMFTNNKIDVTAVAPFEIEFARDDTVIIHSGKVMVTTKEKPTSLYRPVLKTPSVTMGVRGTQFMASYYPLLEESEVIAFKHEVQLTDLSNKKTQVIKENQWGGKGGRFGNELVKPISLPSNVISAFRSSF